MMPAPPIITSGTARPIRARRHSARAVSGTRSSRRRSRPLRPPPHHPHGCDVMTR